MKVDEIKAIARQKQVKIGTLTRTELVRAIQLAEGNSPCCYGNYRNLFLLRATSETPVIFKAINVTWQLNCYGKEPFVSEDQTTSVYPAKERICARNL